MVNVLSHMQLKHENLTKKFTIKTYVDANGLFEEIGEMFKIRERL